MCIVEIAFMALLDGAKQLIADGVKNDVALLISQAESKEQRHAATICEANISKPWGLYQTLQ